MKIILIFAFIFFSKAALRASEGVISKNVQVKKVIYDEKLSKYRLELIRHAGVFKANEQLLKCLSDAVRSQNFIKISYQAVGLNVLTCEKASSK